MTGLQVILPCVLLSCFTISVLSQKVDLTRTEGTKGSEVVDAVINIIRRSCIFEDDLLRLRSNAYTDSDDGEKATTYVMGYTGGIWHISEADFRRTQTEPDLQSYRDAIQQKLYINWATVTYDDLRKPLYSALASQLNIVRIAALTPGVNRRTEAELTQSDFDPRSSPQLLQHNLDVVFLLDSSASMTEADFNAAKDFVKNFIVLLNVDGGLVHVGIVPYSTLIYQPIKLNNNMTKSQLQDAVSGIHYTPGGTNTTSALEYVNSTMFTASSGSRPNAAKVVVLVTDGTSDDSVATILAARTLRASGVSIFAVGVGALINKQELNNVVNRPSCVHLQEIGGYANLPADSFSIAKFVVKAPVMLKPGIYEFDCSTDLHAVVMETGHPMTVEITTADGKVDVFGSTGDFVPSPAIYSFNDSFSSQTSVNIYIRDGSETQLAFRNSSSGGCHSHFILKIEYADHLKTGNHKICVQSKLSSDCTLQDLVDSPFILKATAEPSLDSSCTGSDIFKAPYPHKSDRYLMCDSGKLVVIYCNTNQQYDALTGLCVPVGPATTTVGLIHIGTTTPSLQTTPAAISNPCTPEQIKLQHFIFPYPGNERFFIKCGNFPFAGVVNDCGEHKLYSASIQTCIYRDLVIIQPTGAGNLYLEGIPNPCQPGDTAHYHPHPTDEHKFIQCDDYGDGFVVECKNGEVWDQSIFNCIPKGFVYWTTPAPALIG